MWKNLKLATKLYFSFGSIALIAMFLGLFGYYGAVKNEQSIDEIGIVRLPSVESLLIIKENANALKVVQRTILDFGLERKERERQYTDIGKIREEYQAAWQVYEPLPQTPEEADVWKQFVPAWEQWRSENNTFFDSARLIDGLDLGDPAALTNHIQTFIGDHNRLEARILKLIQNGEQFDGGDNPITCNFGTWVAGFKTSNPQMRQLIEETAGPHTKTHESVKQIKELVASGQADQADYVYRNVFAPNVKETLARFAKILHLAEEAQEQLHEIRHFALNDLREVEKKAIDLLDRLVAINNEVAEHEVESAHHFAVRQAFISAVAALAGVLMAALIAFLITRAITRPLTKAVAVCEELAQGNLTVDIQVDSKDETGQLLAAMKTMVASLRSMFTDITNGVATLSSSSTELSAIATQLSTNSEDASSRSAGVASAAEEMSTNMSSVSAAMEQSAGNVGMVATATEEMSCTVQEIAQNAAKAKDISEQAVGQSQQASSKMNDLGQAADKIGMVTEAITEISEQTNLLALNATIEAARAGEAGKGFAVVANEIKELAKQTASATVDIKQQIEEMQHTTGGAITDIDKIGHVINEINEIVTTIATAVEQQSAATSEISENIAQASDGIAEVNENVAQSTVAITDITKDISEINNSSGEVNQGSHNVNESATELSRLAEQLNGLVRGFKLA
ncbi:methyl-accepting chemotaxis protein [Desulfogranum marinum]|uniref:methyl-accepting chemotaxis protein n=1 Tax=Desulfogranum marinum TaxID=453220 RepID=UPI0019640039|nr:methyl-accepting chemotaxis protein [Desulfogranum marinum]MBM9514896.1 methyl-accepting chemotaxis protein [Desulfogranum marinum]